MVMSLGLDSLPLHFQPLILQNFSTSPLYEGKSFGSLYKESPQPHLILQTQLLACPPVQEFLFAFRDSVTGFTLFIMLLPSFPFLLSFPFIYPVFSLSFTCLSTFPPLGPFSNSPSPFSLFSFPLFCPCSSHSPLFLP